MFQGFGPQTLGFFRALAFHQNKEWFEENRTIYESEVKLPMQALVADLCQRFAESGIPLTAEPAKAMFRLHRDIRFAREKHPYKTHGAALMSRDGTKRSPGLLYIHIDPKGCFLAAGFYMPEPDELQALRVALRDRPSEWQAVAAALSAAGLVLDREDEMKRLPRGYEAMKGMDGGALFRLRHFTVTRPLDDSDIFLPTLLGRVQLFTQQALPLLRFGWEILGPSPAGR